MTKEDDNWKEDEKRRWKDEKKMKKEDEDDYICPDKYKSAKTRVLALLYLSGQI